MKAAIGPETAGIIVEPLQGEGGIRPMSEEYLRELRKIADEFRILLMFDEVQCGVGRTGKLYAHEWAGVTPDIMASAKGLGGGFPIGATLHKGRVAEAMTAGSHGTTYGETRSLWQPGTRFWMSFWRTASLNASKPFLQSS